MNERSLGGKVLSYIIGFVMSVAITIMAYVLVVEKIWPNDAIIFTVAGLAVLQLIVQLIFFLHLGQSKGQFWTMVTFWFAILVIFILVAGSIWVMYHLNHNMMDMTPAQQTQYMKNNESI